MVCPETLLRQVAGARLKKKKKKQQIFYPQKPLSPERKERDLKWVTKGLSWVLKGHKDQSRIDLRCGKMLSDTENARNINKNCYEKLESIGIEKDMEVRGIGD
eukprot:TRINITY_DN17094_c0_g1_i1.p1 TRINITY_DN17094_c0_g1~~TRINITY_DN17094_c0_g1_i1.p1  ORF type:complete len:103 (-),score=23.13 TRINITY_DN17094_c0_g1_i1:665-973(-)